MLKSHDSISNSGEIGTKMVEAPGYLKNKIGDICETAGVIDLFNNKSNAKILYLWDCPTANSKVAEAERFFVFFFNQTGQHLQ
jgi:hypothetical protein